jgi:hypothetical protein
LAQIHATGATPAQVAPLVLGDWWDLLPEASRRRLAAIGLASLLAGDLTRERSSQAPTLPGLSPAELRRRVEDLHDRIDCPFSSHTVFRKKLNCVRHLLRLSGRALEEAIAEERRRHQAMGEQEDEMYSRSWANIGEAFRRFHDAAYGAALDDLRSIILVGADNRMKDLLSFSREDAATWRRQAQAQARGWRRRQQFFALVEDKLAAEDAACVRELTVATIKELGQRARKVWKG